MARPACRAGCLAGVTAIADQTWYHVVLQREEDLVTIWLDGALEDEAELTGNVHDGAAAFMIGAHTDTTGAIAGCFSGTLADH